jgi:phage-related minor tail protein
MAESDGRVEYEVRADLSKIDSDMDAANKQITKSAEKVAKQQEQITEKSQQNIKKTVEKANDSLEQDNEKTQKNIAQTVEKQSDKIVKTEEKNKKAITKTAKTESEKVVKNHKKATEEVVNQTEKAAKEIEGKTTGLGSKITAGLSTAGKGLAAGIGAGLAAAGTVAVAATGKAISAANDLDKANNQLTASLGLTAEEAEKYGDIIKKVYGDNYGESFDDISNTLALIKQQMKDVTDDELQKVIESAYLLSDTYDIDVSEGIRGANALMKQFGITAEEAYNLLAQGAEKGLNQNGDIADQLAEYSTYYADMGFTAEETMSMMAEGAKNGAFQIDFLNDAFKEFSIRAKDGSQTTADGMALLGLDATKLGEEFAAGGDRAYQAFKLVNEKLAECKSDVDRNAAGVALYGTKWEDLGEDAILAMAHMGNSIDKTRDKLGEMESVKYNSLSDMCNGLSRTIELLLIPLGEQIIPVLKDIIELIEPIISELLPQIIEQVKPILDSVSELIPPLIELITGILPQFMELLKPILESVTRIIQKLVPTLIKLFDKLLPPIIKIVDTLLPPLIEVIEALLPVLDIVIELLTPILKLVAELAEPLGAVISAVGKLLSAVIGLIDGALTPIKPILEILSDVLSDRLGSALNVVADLISAVANVFAGVLNFLSGDIMGGFESFGNGLVNLFDGVLSTIDSIFGTNLTNWYNEVKEACQKIGEEMYAATHQGEIRANELSTKYNDLQSNMNSYIVKELRSGKSADEALSNAKNKFLDTAEKKEYFNSQLKDYVNEDKVKEWYNNVRSNNGLYSQGYSEEEGNSSYSQNIAEEEERKGKAALGYTGAGTNYSYSSAGKASYKAPTYSYTPSTYSASDYAYVPKEKEEKKTSSSSSTKKTSSSAASSANKSQTISITSYIPTVWDDADTANQKLAAGIGASRVGNSKSGKLISGLSAATAVSSGKAEKADATLNDVVAEIKKLKTAQEKMQYTLDVTLKTNEYTLAKATVKGIKAIKKQTGKSPI